MSPAPRRGPGAFRCGCGATVALAGLPKFDASHCSVFLAGRVCNGPKEPGHITCEPCAVKIARNALVLPETAEQLAVHVERGAFLELRRLERERLEAEARVKARESSPRPDRARRFEVVYYCQTRPGVIKIGTSAQLYVRMEAFRVADADVLAAEPGSYPLEAMRHKQFAHLRIDGLGRREDFRLDDQLKSHITMLAEMYGKPFDFVEEMLARQEEVAEAAK